tara:strand:- start:51 stop:1364 length:1314 start_codon:yes stop_codon:yes gene_type:complete
MKYGSVCSGIEAATAAWHPLGWEPQWFSEVDPFPSAVLQHHYPHIPNHGDMTKYKEWNNDKTIELLVGGTPCQSFSIAGLRKGLSDPRGNLMLTYLAMAEQFKPKWLVWENVPGVLSSNGGRDFGTFLGALGKIGYGFSYRVLDAQFFGIPQRRRRVFVVGCFGDWRSAASVLLEPESMSGNPPPSREAGQRVAPTVTVGPPFSRTGNSRVETEALVTYAMPGNWIGRKPENGGNQVEPFVDLSPCQTATDVHAVVTPRKTGSHWDGDFPHPTLTQSAKGSGGIGASNQEVFGGRGAGLVPARMRGFGDYIQDETASTVKARDYKDATDLVATAPSKATGETTLSDVTMSLTASYGQGGADLATKPMVCSSTVRRLTPKECERLQGFPDDYSRIAWRNKEPEDCPNGHRYKALGNSMAVPVMNWIGRRIDMVEKGEL